MHGALPPGQLLHGALAPRCCEAVAVDVLDGLERLHHPHHLTWSPGRMMYGPSLKSPSIQN
jgi:hypothetical protein